MPGLHIREFSPLVQSDDLTVDDSFVGYRTPLIASHRVRMAIATCVPTSDEHCVTGPVSQPAHRELPAEALEWLSTELPQPP
jgi:hypothetical protein